MKAQKDWVTQGFRGGGQNKSETSGGCSLQPGSIIAPQLHLSRSLIISTPAYSWTTDNFSAVGGVCGTYYSKMLLIFTLVSHFLGRHSFGANAGGVFFPFYSNTLCQHILSLSFYIIRWPNPKQEGYLFFIKEWIVHRSFMGNFQNLPLSNLFLMKCSWWLLCSHQSQQLWCTAEEGYWANKVEICQEVYLDIFKGKKSTSLLNYYIESSHLCQR